jgi:hypothetical protein
MNLTNDKMKKIIQHIGFVIFALLIAACNKDFEEPNLLTPALNPVQPDANAGSWKPILLTSTSEFLVPAPASY